MASVTSTSCLHRTVDASQTSLSCGIRVYEGLRVQSPHCYGAGKTNSNVGFHNKVYKSINFRCGKPTRGRVSMMPIGTPRVPYRQPVEGTSTWIDLWNALYRERVIFIAQNIDEQFSNQVLATMLYLDSVDDSKKLNLYINCRGGDLTPCMALYDTMQSLKSPVGTNCIGGASNLAGFLLAAGEKGSRSAMPRSRIALESPAGAARGQADDIRNEANALNMIRDYLFKELAEKTGQPVDKIHKDLSHKKMFNARSALEYGLIDRIIKPAPINPDTRRKIPQL